MRTFIIFTLCLGACLAQRSRPEEEQGRGPCRRANGLFPHEEYCDKYYKCRDNKYTVIDCPNGLMFAGRRSLKDNCDYSHNVDCGNRRQRNPPLGSKPCNYLYTLADHETSCTKYVSCWNGSAQVIPCAKGLLWNPELSSCDWPENVQGCESHPLCKDLTALIIDYPGKDLECHKYVQCIGGYPRVQKCPAGLAYSSQSKSCRYYQEVPECADFFTTTPEPYIDSEEEEEDGGNRRPAQRVRQRFRPETQEVRRPTPQRGF